MASGRIQGLVRGTPPTMVHVESIHVFHEKGACGATGKLSFVDHEVISLLPGSTCTTHSTASQVAGAPYVQRLTLRDELRTQNRDRVTGFSLTLRQAHRDQFLCMSALFNTMHAFENLISTFNEKPDNCAHNFVHKEHDRTSRFRFSDPTWQHDSPEHRSRQTFRAIPGS